MFQLYWSHNPVKRKRRSPRYPVQFFYIAFGRWEATIFHHVILLWFDFRLCFTVIFSVIQNALSQVL